MNDEILTAYRDPERNKSRELLPILLANSRQTGITEYFHQSPGKKVLARICRLPHISRGQALRMAEPNFKITGLDNKSVSDEHILTTIGDNPPFYNNQFFSGGTRRSTTGHWQKHQASYNPGGNSDFRSIPVAAE